MRVLFTNPDRTEAVVVRGRWFPKFAAVRYGKSTRERLEWTFASSGKYVGGAVDTIISRAKEKEESPWR